MKRNPTENARHVEWPAAPPPVRVRCTFVVAVALVLTLFILVGCQLVADIHPRDFELREMEERGDAGDGGTREDARTREDAEYRPWG